MTRQYKQKRRAEQTAETRRRIVEATVALHGRVGPAATTFKMIAEEAGVQRHTLYSHFADERSLFQACSALHLETNPPPDVADWEMIADPTERLRKSLGELYAWFEANEGITACVLRDGEFHEPTREINAIRLCPIVASWERALGVPEAPPARAALLRLALSFWTWRTLFRDGGLTSEAAAEAMTKAVLSAPAEVVVSGQQPRRAAAARSG